MALGIAHSLSGQSSGYKVTTLCGLPPIPGTRLVSGPDGTLYIASYSQDSVFKFTLNGTLTLLAGGGTGSGFVNGTGENARFNGPTDLAWDPQGNLFVLDSANFAIRKVTPAGVVSTFVGGVAAGDADGDAATAKFSYMNGIATDTVGNLYVADMGNVAVRRVTPEGIVSTICKGIRDSNGAVDFLPLQVAVGPDNEVYVLPYEPSIWKIGPNGTRSLVVGSMGLSSTQTVGASFRIDRNGDFIIANGYCWKVPKNGGVATVLGEAWDVAFDNPGNSYFLSTVSKKIALDGTVTDFAGRIPGFVDGPARTARFNLPVGLVRDRQGNLFVSDSANHAIRKVSPDGTVTTFAGGVQGLADGQGAAAKFNNPQGLAIDGAGTIYVADYDNHAIRTISPAGQVTTLAGMDGTAGSIDGPVSTAQFKQPYCLAIDPSGAIYVSDLGNHRLRRIFAGQVATIRLGYYYGSTFIPSFLSVGLIFNSKGELFTAGGDAVDKITGLPDNPVGTRFAGYGWDYGLADGIGTGALFSQPTAMAMDRDENIYVTDSFNNAIRKITPDAIVTTLAGNGKLGGFADGFGRRARFASPRGIVLGDNGELYVSDTDNHTIRMLVPPMTAPTSAVITISVE